MIPDSPFAPACSRQAFLETLGVGEALRRLEEGLGAREPFLLVVGEPGTGKTALAHEASGRWESRVATAFLACRAQTGAELIEEIVLRLGGDVPDGAGRPKLMACLDRSLADLAGQGKIAMLVVDDAQRLPHAVLEELRLLADAAQQARRPMEVLLMGPPALEAALDDPAVAALRQRVSVRVRLEPLSAGEVRRYIRHRVDVAGGDGSSLFSRQTCLDIATASHGVPRRINALAGEALRLARAAGDDTVRSEHVQSAAASLWGPIPVSAPAASDAEERSEPRAKAASSTRPEPSKAAPASPTKATVAPTKATAPPTKAASPAPSPDPPSRAGVPPEPAPAPPRAAEPAPVPQPAEPAPKPQIVAKPPPAPPPAPATEDAPRPATPATHDPREWVSRFVGESGPLQIGSRAALPARWEMESLDAPAEDQAVPAVSSPKRRGAPRVPTPRAPHPGRMRVATMAALVAIVVIAAVVLVVRMGARRATNPPSNQPAIAGPPSDAVATPSPNPLSDAPRVQRAKPPAGGPAPSTSSERPSRGPFTLEVASVRDLADAFDERDRLQALTGFEGWVVPAPEGSSEPHRVVVGVYRSRERAQAAADMLLRSRTLPNVTVVPLPRRSARR